MKPESLAIFGVDALLQIIIWFLAVQAGYSIPEAILIGFSILILFVISAVLNRKKLIEALQALDELVG